METRVCTTCKKEKPITEFHRKGAGRRYKCKACMVIYQKEWYAKNRKKHIRAVEEWKRANKAWYREYKKGLSCETCGENRHQCLDFHHKDEREKESAVSNLYAQGQSVQRMLREMAKCIVLCSNCHRALHWEKSHKDI